MRRPKAHRGLNGDGRGQLTAIVHISARPAEAEDRAVPGHWEGDLLLGKAMSGIATLVERSSRFLLLIKLERINSENVVAALAQHILTLPEQLRRSLTWDQGKEMAQHARSRSTPVCRSISVTRKAPGRGAATRAPMGCCASMSPSVLPTFGSTRRLISTRLPPS